MQEPVTRWEFGRNNPDLYQEMMALGERINATKDLYFYTYGYEIVVLDLRSQWREMMADNCLAADILSSHFNYDAEGVRHLKAWLERKGLRLQFGYFEAGA